MAKVKLQPLDIFLHEPDSNLLLTALDNEMWQLSYTRQSRSVTHRRRAATIDQEIVRRRDTVRQLQRQLNILRNWRLRLDPYVDPLRLIPLYKKRKIAIPADIQQWSRKFDFFELTFGGGIFVRKGMSVKKLEIGIVFDTELDKKRRRSVAYGIFPTNEWKKYGEISFSFGISGDLGFKVPLTASGLPFAKLGDITPEAKARFLLGPFAYSFRKAVIRGVGKGDYLINWVIEKGEILDGGDFETRVILKVPKGRKKVKTKVAVQATVTPPKFWDRILGRARKIAPDEKVYDIVLT
jgi:hypothetical protein